MTITHHPDISTLMCCAAGSQPEAFAAVVASHLALCPECRAEVRHMQEIGVALFDKDVDVGLIGVTRTEAGAHANKAMPHSRMTQR